MKIICTQENLKAGILTVGRIISSSNTLPILNNILLKTENGLLKISSTNLEIAITTHIRCKAEEEGEVTVVGKTFMDLVNNLPNKNVSLESQNGQLSIEAENYHTSIKTLPAEEFPLIPSVEAKETITINQEDLKKAVDQVVFAASLNQTQPEISGVLLAFGKGELRVVATDRYRLAEKKLTLAEKNFNLQEVIVPQKTIVELSRIIANQKGNAELVLNETQISFTINDTQIISRLIDGQYPDYKQIVPTDFLTTIVTQRTALVNALRAGGIFSQSNNSVKLEYLEEKQNLTLVSESSELGKSVVDLPSEIKGKSGSIIVNFHYILDCLTSVDSENLIIKIIDDSSPSLIIPEGDESYMYLVMPIKS